MKKPKLLNKEYKVTKKEKADLKENIIIEDFGCDVYIRMYNDERSKWVSVTGRIFEKIAHDFLAKRKEYRDFWGDEI